MKNSETLEKSWTLEPSSTHITFSIRQVFIAHIRGHFKQFTADIVTMGNDFRTADVDFVVDANSIETGDSRRDELIKGADFLDVKHYSQIHFSSHSISSLQVEGKRELSGDLTMKGHTQKVNFELQFGPITSPSSGNEQVSLHLSGSIDRSSWGLIWKTEQIDKGFLVSRSLHIDCRMTLLSSLTDPHIMKLQESEFRDLKNK